MEYSIYFAPQLLMKCCSRWKLSTKQAAMLWWAVEERHCRMLVTKNNYQSLINKYILTCGIPQKHISLDTYSFIEMVKILTKFTDTYVLLSIYCFPSILNGTVTDTNQPTKKRNYVQVKLYITMTSFMSQHFKYFNCPFLTFYNLQSQLN
jgi:hypothetical protein